MRPVPTDEAKVVKPTRLLAKSSRTPETPLWPEQLVGHTQCVLAAALQLLEVRGVRALTAMDIGRSLVDRLRLWVLIGAFVHDFGKSSDHFQKMVWRERHERQLVRHEACSLYLTWPGQRLSSWLLGAVQNERDLRFALIAAAGHHRKFTREAVAPDDSGAGTSLTLWTSHEDFRRTLELGVDQFGLLPPPELHDQEIAHGRRSEILAFLERCEDEVDALRPTGEERRLLALAKGFLIAADVAGSTLPRTEQSEDWIDTALARPRDPNDLKRLITDRLKGGSLRPFQHEVAASSEPVTLVRAGCGTGKTLAAYAWAAQSHPGRTVWITYPTTGTATEGFRDYVHETDVRGRLDHGRASVDVEIFGLDDGTDGQRELDRLDAIRAWDMDVVTCTVDVVLGITQNQRKGLYALPSLVYGVAVFDEIHAYDDSLFGALLRFLDAFPGTPVLIMTASLPEGRLKALDHLVTSVHGRSVSIVEGPADLERLPRYRRSYSEPEQAIRETIEARGKVLWVSNTVDRCTAVASRLQQFSPLIYHSRFRYIDRVACHGAVVDAFGQPGPAFVTATQVAEMSLDLSADLLVMDRASIPAMIQRLGRLNRRSCPEAPRSVGRFIVVEPERSLPYSDPELAAAQQWLNRLGDGDLSQRDLIDAWKTDNDDVPSARRSVWLDELFLTEAAPLRDLAPGVTVVLQDDLSAIEKDSRKAVKLALPMGPPPTNVDWRRWPRAMGVYPVAPEQAIQYDKQYGGRWRK